METHTKKKKKICLTYFLLALSEVGPRDKIAGKI